MRNLLVIGAGSRIGSEFARIAAAGGASVLLSGRSLPDASRSARDVALRAGAGCVIPAGLDLSVPGSFAGFFESHTPPGGFDGILIASGLMPPETAMAGDPELFASMASSNFTGVVQLIDRALPYLNSGGFISCISSVAGDRGRASNFRYGSTKAGLSAYLEGLAASRKDGLLVQDVKLGPVDTPMNSGVRRAPFLIAPERAAELIWLGVRRRQRRIYVPARWRWIMLVIRLLPFSIYKSLPL